MRFSSGNLLSVPCLRSPNLSTESGPFFNSIHHFRRATQHQIRPPRNEPKMTGIVLRPGRNRKSTGTGSRPRQPAEAHPTMLLFRVARRGGCGERKPSAGFWLASSGASRTRAHPVVRTGARLHRYRARRLRGEEAHRLPAAQLSAVCCRRAGCRSVHLRILARRDAAGTGVHSIGNAMAGAHPPRLVTQCSQQDPDHRPPQPGHSGRQPCHSGKSGRGAPPTLPKRQHRHPKSAVAASGGADRNLRRSARCSRHRNRQPENPQ